MEGKGIEAIVSERVMHYLPHMPHIMTATGRGSLGLRWMIGEIRARMLATSGMVGLSSDPCIGGRTKAWVV